MRMNKIEKFAQYFICNSFFDLEIDDLKKRLEMRQLSQFEKAAEDLPEDTA